MILPRLRNHHHDRLLQSTACHEQKFKNIVERTRIATVWLNNWQKFPELFAEQRRGEHTLPRLHPVHIAAQCIDLTIMAHTAAGLCAIPGRKSIRRKSRVDHG